VVTFTRRKVISTLSAATAAIKNQAETLGSSKTKSSKRRKTHTFSSLMYYFGAVIMIASLVTTGYQAPVDQELASVNDSSTAIQAANPSVDQLLAADLAASVAEVANLSVATNAANLTISLNAKSELSQANDSTILTKPQVIDASSQRRGVTEYTTVAGDSVPAIAQRFGLTAETVRWANSLVGDAIGPDRKLLIPGVDGVVYTTNGNDTLDGIASRYNVSKDRIVLYNDLGISGLGAGQRLVLPGGVLPENERPGYTAPRSTSRVAVVQPSYANAAIAGNRYDYGYCTWYAYNRRAELGRPVGSFWGNAATWASYARGSGYTVSSTPIAGAVMQTANAAGGYGHVAVVERVNSDGSIFISEMNYAGWNVYSTRTLDAGQVGSYNYIY
jgi:surface antigen